MKWIVNAINWLLTPLPFWIAENQDYADIKCSGYHLRWLPETQLAINNWANKWNIPLHISEPTECHYMLDENGDLDKVVFDREWMAIEFQNSVQRRRKATAKTLKVANEYVARNQTDSVSVRTSRAG